MRPSMHEPCPFPEGLGIHRQYAAGGKNLIKPQFQFLCLHRILLSSNLNPRLNLTYRDSRNRELLGRHALNPLQHGPMWIWPPKF